LVANQLVPRLLLLLTLTAPVLFCLVFLGQATFQFSPVVLQVTHAVIASPGHLARGHGLDLVRVEVMHAAFVACGMQLHAFHATNRRDAFPQSLGNTRTRQHADSLDCHPAACPCDMPVPAKTVVATWWQPMATCGNLRNLFSDRTKADNEESRRPGLLLAGRGSAPRTPNRECWGPGACAVRGGAFRGSSSVTVSAESARIVGRVSTGRRGSSSLHSS